MKKSIFQLNYLLIVALLFLFACSQQSEKESNKHLINLKDTTTLHPTIIPINTDCLTVIPVDESKLKRIPVGKPEVISYSNAPITPGVSYLPQTKEEIAAGKKPIKASLPKVVKTSKPKVYNLVKEGFEIQYGDTIFAPKVIRIVKSKPTDTIDYTIQLLFKIC